MEIRPIRDEADHDTALEAIDGLMGAEPDTPEADRLEVLVTLVEAYESRRWPMDAPDPVSMIEHVMEARGYRQKDLAAVIGSQPHASEVLNRRRPLSLPMIRALSSEWGLPADALVREYDRNRSGRPWRSGRWECKRPKCAILTCRPSQRPNQLHGLPERLLSM